MSLINATALVVIKILYKLALMQDFVYKWLLIQISEKVKRNINFVFIVRSEMVNGFV